MNKSEKNLSKGLLENVLILIKCPFIIIPIIFIAICYSYTITHFSIGVDDTAMKLYFEDGMAVNSGRWTLFFLNRILHLNFINWPTWITEIIAVFLLFIAALFWVSNFNIVFSQCKRNVENKCYLVTSLIAVSLFVSNSIISEIFVYYIHNGICLGYCLCALAVYELIVFLSDDQKVWKKVHYIILSIIFLIVSVGCYETMLECFVIGALLCFFITHTFGSQENRLYSFFSWVVSGALVCFITVLARTVILFILKKVYSLESMSIGYNKLFGDCFSERGYLSMLIKKIYMKYYVHSVVYLPITIYVIAIIILFFVSICTIIKKRDFFPLASLIGIALFQILMSIVAGRAEAYHSAQFLPVVSMAAYLVVGNTFFSTPPPHSKFNNVAVASFLTIGIISCILQSIDMNKWFIQDYKKSEEAKQIMTEVAEELLDNYDYSKPVVIEGATLFNPELYAEACIPFSSWKYRIICYLTNPIDIHLKEKFNANYAGLGYAYAESPTLSVLTWAHNPFENASPVKNQQYINYWKMIGYNQFSYIETDEIMNEASEIRKEKCLPGYPNDGYIYETDDYIIISLSPYDN